MSNVIDFRAARLKRAQDIYEESFDYLERMKHQPWRPRGHAPDCELAKLLEGM